MIVESLKNTVVQLILFIGIVYLVGFLIHFFSSRFYGMFTNSRAVCLATGFIGTPIHELSHAIMCLIFGHKIQEIKLFQVDDSGTLGYVNHTYKPKNLYHLVGNYFIGVAPLVGGSIFLYLMMWLLLPSSFTVTTILLEDLTQLQQDGLDLTFLVYLGKVMATVISSIFTYQFGWRSIVFLVLVVCMSLHMNLSQEDVKGSLTALPLIAGLLLVVNLLLGLIPGVYSLYLAGVCTAAAILLFFLMMGLTFSALIFLSAKLISLLIKTIRK